MDTTRLSLVVAGLLGIVSAGPVGCGDDSSAPTFDADACSSFQVPNRLGYRWSNLNHRLSRWGHHLTPIAGDSAASDPPAPGCEADTLQTSFVGGTFTSGEEDSDTPNLRYAYQSASSQPRVLGAARRQLSTVITATPSGKPEGPRVDGTATGRRTWQRDQLQLKHYDRVAALIQGFEFFTDLPQSSAYPDTYNPADGYTSRGITVSVAVAELTDDTVTIEWRLRFGLGATEDRETMNRAIPHARIGAQLDVLLVGTSSSRLHRATTSYDLSYPHQQPFQQRLLEPADAETRRVTVQGDSAHGAGIWGFHTLSFRLEPDVGCAPNQERCPAGDVCGDDQTCDMTYGPAGYYIRELTADITMENYDEQTGRAQFMVNGFASNASQAITFYALNHSFSAGVTWIQTDGAPRRRTLDQSHPVGAHTIDLQN